MRKDILEFLPAHNDDYDLTVRSCAGVLWLFLTVPLIGMQCVIVVFPGHTHLLFLV